MCIQGAALIINSPLKSNFNNLKLLILLRAEGEKQQRSLSCKYSALFNNLGVFVKRFGTWPGLEQLRKIGRFNKNNKSDMISA